MQSAHLSIWILRKGRVQRAQEKRETHSQLEGTVVLNTLAAQMLQSWWIDRWVPPLETSVQVSEFHLVNIPYPKRSITLWSMPVLMRARNPKALQAPQRQSESNRSNKQSVIAQKAVIIHLVVPPIIRHIAVGQRLQSTPLRKMPLTKAGSSLSVDYLPRCCMMLQMLLALLLERLSMGYHQIWILQLQTLRLVLFNMKILCFNKSWSNSSIRWISKNQVAA